MQRLHSLFVLRIQTLLFQQTGTLNKQENMLKIFHELDFM